MAIKYFLENIRFVIYSCLNNLLTFILIQFYQLYILMSQRLFLYWYLSWIQLVGSVWLCKKYIIFLLIHINDKHTINLRIKPTFLIFSVCLCLLTRTIHTPTKYHLFMNEFLQEKGIHTKKLHHHYNPQDATLNSRDGVFNSCRHKRKHTLKHTKTWVSKSSCSFL